MSHKFIVFHELIEYLFQIPHHQNQNFKELLLWVKNKHFCLASHPSDLRSGTCFYDYQLSV